MLERIIVAWDGSDLAREAFAYATMLAQAIGAGAEAGSPGVEVMGVYVIEPVTLGVDIDPVAMLDPMVPPVMMPTMPIQTGPTPEEERVGAERDFAELERSCARIGVKFSRSIETGELDERLAARAGARDMIAVGMKGRFRSSGIGSTTRSLVMQAPCAVMVVAGKSRPLNRVLAAYDGTAASKRALAFSRDLARQTGWPLSVLAVARGARSAASDTAAVEEMTKQAQELAPEGTVMSMGSAGQTEAELIARVAERDSYALLVLGAYADSRIKDLLFGSTTGHVLAKLGSPVVLVH